MPYKKEFSGFGEGTGYTPPSKTTNEDGSPILDGDGNYLHDWGYNIDPDAGFGERGSGPAYKGDESGKARYALDQKEQFGITSKNDIEEGWSGYMEENYPDAGIDANMEAVDVTPKMQADRDAKMSKGSGSGGSVSKTPNRDKRLANFREGKRLKAESVSNDKTLNWRQTRRLLSGDGQSKKSHRQLKRLRNQEARKKQRAKNRRERGWGGFGWNRPK